MGNTTTRSFNVDSKNVCAQTAEAAEDGIIIVDLPPEEAAELFVSCKTHDLSNIPFVAPTRSDDRIGFLTTEEKANAVREKIAPFCTGLKQSTANAKNQSTKLGALPEAIDVEERNKVIHFGKFEGQFIPETLSEAFREIEEKYNPSKSDPDFLTELAVYRKDFVNGPMILLFTSQRASYGHVRRSQDLSQA
jgi:hypothetical protein